VTRGVRVFLRNARVSTDKRGKGNKFSFDGTIDGSKSRKTANASGLPRASVERGPRPRDMIRAPIKKGSKCSNRKLGVSLSPESDTLNRLQRGAATGRAPGPAFMAQKKAKKKGTKGVEVGWAGPGAFNK